VLFTATASVASLLQDLSENSPSILPGSRVNVRSLSGSRENNVESLKAAARPPYGD